MEKIRIKGIDCEKSFRIRDVIKNKNELREGNDDGSKRRDWEI